MQNVPVIGIDISKKNFDVCALFDAKIKHHLFDNHNKGFERFLSWIQDLGLVNPHLCMESTGSYSDALSIFLYNRGYQVSVINPLRIKAFRISQMIRQKTDKSDSEVIGRFCLQNCPELWTPKPRENREVHEINGRINGLKEEMNRLKNALEKEVLNKIVSLSIHEEMDFLRKMIEKLEQEALTLIHHSTKLTRQFSLLTAIKGVGPKTALTILGDMPDVSLFKNAKQYAAFAGVTPSHVQSGSSVRGQSHISRLGSKKVRKALYMAAIVVKNHNEEFQGFVSRLVNKGKKPKVIIVAIMRKLLHIFFGILKNNQSFDQKMAFPT